MVAGMGWLRNLITRSAGIVRAADESDGMADGVRPPERRLDYGDPLSLSTIFRAVQILQTSIVNLPLVQTRNGIEVEPSPIVRRPDPLVSRSRLISETVADLALNGNAFWQKVRAGDAVVGVRLLPARLVAVRATSDDPASPMPVFDYGGRTYRTDDILHMRFLEVSGRLRGLGPIQAAREEVESAAMLRDMKREWFSDGSNAKIVLTTEQPMENDAAAMVKKRFSDGRPGEVKVLGWGTKVERLALSPKDLEYLDMMQFDTTQIARLMGIPASLMLAAVEGSNLTYQNIEQSWIEFADYTLAAYASEIGEALTSLLPRGNEVAFDTDPSRRSNTKDRFETYRIAVEAKLMTVPEARKRLGMGPMPATETEEANA